MPWGRCRPFGLAGNSRLAAASERFVPLDSVEEKIISTFNQSAEKITNKPVRSLKRHYHKKIKQKETVSAYDQSRGNGENFDYRNKKITNILKILPLGLLRLDIGQKLHISHHCVNLQRFFESAADPLCIFVQF